MICRKEKENSSKQHVIKHMEGCGSLSYEYHPVFFASVASIWWWLLNFFQSFWYFYVRLPLFPVEFCFTGFPFFRKHTQLRVGNRMTVPLFFNFSLLYNMLQFFIMP